jgi:hypothetical protein
LHIDEIGSLVLRSFPHEDLKNFLEIRTWAGIKSRKLKKEREIIPSLSMD